jgi:hypothetical protein
MDVEGDGNGVPQRTKAQPRDYEELRKNLKYKILLKQSEDRVAKVKLDTTDSTK